MSDSRDPFPEGVGNANWFQLFNSISFQIFLGAPTILYAKSLGASATLLGIIASLTPPLTTLQLPAANHIARIGYRRFVFAGWGLRNVCVLFVALLPLAPGLSTETRLILLLVLQFLFNALRGVTSGAWFPWITELLPERIRARFLSRDHRFGQTGSLLALLASACILQQDSAPWRFAVVFLISAVGGAISLHFLNKVPDVVAPEKLKRSGAPVPWGTLISYPPFLRMVIFNVLFVFMVGSVGVFTVSFLKGRIGYGDNEILLFLCANFLGALMTLHWSGILLDRIGPKRTLRLAFALHGVFVVGWIALACHFVRPNVPMLVMMYLIVGVASGALNLANSKLAMSIIPEMGRNHFSAFYSVVTSLVLGASPILWGLFLDTLGDAKWPALGVVWDRYSIYFLAIGLLNVAVWFAISILREDRGRVAANP